mmetsp:Transcript_96039/g.222640  ORF Transcript_96039/g.222640 Transcript_96039/m.222640 type:complete len:238 (-) Transcript_96039:130-843(-)
MEKSSSTGSLPPQLRDDKYMWFSDANAMKDRLAFTGRYGTQTKPPPIEESGFASSGWDKYFFFSVPPGVEGIHVTSRKGRARPAAYGPQTFQMEAFSPEQLERARKRSTSSRTTYMESYNQFPRSSTYIHGPIDERMDLKASLQQPLSTAGSSRPSSGTLARAASESVLDNRSAVEILAGPTLATRMGPHWPPPGPERPDPLKTRERLMKGPHRTIVDLHARDRQAPRTWQYTVTNC